MKNKGLTLVETLIAISISGFVGVGFYNYVDDNTKTQNFNNSINEIDSVMLAFDERLDIDGYDVSLWNDTKWDTTEKVVSNLIQKEFQSKSADKCSGTWEPKFTTDDNINLVSCDLWKRKTPFDFEADLKMDVNDFIIQASLYIKPIDEKIDKNNFKEIQKLLTLLKGRSNKTKNGNVFYEFYSIKDSKYLLRDECLDDFGECSIKATYNRLGDSESIYNNGSNYMIDSKITFAKDTKSAPLQCIRWLKSKTGEWSLATGNNDCGIGMYNDPSYPIIVEVAAKNATFENVVIDKECTMYNWNSSNKTLFDSGVATPCGLSQEGTSVYQIIQNTKSTNVFTENSYFENVDADELTVKKLITENISAKYVVVKNDIEINGKALINDMNINGVSNFYGDLDIKSALTITHDITFYDTINILKDLKIDNNLDVNNLTVENGSFDTLESYTSLKSKKITTNKHLNLKGIYSNGSSCSSNGAISRDSTANLLNCINGTWIAINQSDIVGTIMTWSNRSIPEGWIECNGQSTSSYPDLRAVVGYNVPDLRGQFVRGWQSDNSRIHNEYGVVLDAGRAFKGRDTDQFRAHSHLERHFSGGKDDKGNSTSANNALTTVNTTSVGGNESRPENIALIYIIKAE